MRKSLLGCTALVVLGGICSPPTYASSLQELQQEKAQLLKENAELREIIRIQRENAALRGQALRALPAVPAAQAASPSAVSPPKHARPAVPSAAPAPAVEALRSPQANGWYAADMPLKAMPPPARIYDWTGPYAGVNLGWSTGASRARQSDTFFTSVRNSFGGDNVVSPNGIVGGAQLGYNWQGGRNWLVGVEADIQGSDQHDTGCGLVCLTATQATTTESTFGITQRLDYFATARARFGFVQDSVLFYLTGGGAFGRVRIGNDLRQSVGGGGLLTVQTETVSSRFGWVAGGGAEASLGGRWTGKLEYLYLDLGNASDTLTTSVSGVPFSVTSSGNFRDHIFRGGINYRFGAEPAYAAAGPLPMVYAAAPYQWTGFYAGGNVGLGIGTTRSGQTEFEPLVPPFSAMTTRDGVLSPFGVIGGVQAGYNWQGGRNWLVGFEADIQGSSQHDNACLAGECSIQTDPGPVTNSIAFTIEQRLEYFGTARGRIGFVNNNILFYGTGGLAFGRVNETVAFNSSGPGTSNLHVSSTTTSDQVGWAAGGGIEAALGERLTAKVEYLHLDLGSVTNALALVVAGQPAETTTTTSKVRDDIVRAGFNYRIGP
jgi:outer membrane immunogenic protein